MEKLVNNLGEYWITEEGVLYKKVKENAHIDLIELKKSLTQIKEFTGHKKILMFYDGRGTHFTVTHEAMEYYRTEVAAYSIASAIVSDRIGVRVMVDFAVKIMGVPSPVKMFKDAEKAMKWLLTFKKVEANLSVR
ncbi:MAG TPA: hypothetical protein VK890_01650 [Bacteroidia bacterium]|jgi:hypothetical protein|nr:hypothetical protein [Bacteroidia bacterium]